MDARLPVRDLDWSRNVRDVNSLSPLAPKGIAQPGYDYLVGRGVPAERLDELIPRFDLRFDEQERRVALLKKGR